MPINPIFTCLLIARKSIFQGEGNPICFSRDASRLLVIKDSTLQGTNPVLELYDVQKQKKLASLKVPKTGPSSYSYSLAISNDNSTIVMHGGSAGSIYVFDGMLNKRSTQGNRNFGRHVGQVAVSPDGKQLAYSTRWGSDRNVIHIVDSKDMSPVMDVDAGKNWFNLRVDREGYRFAFSDDGERLYVTTGSSDAGLEVWDLANNKLMKRVGVVNRFGPGFLYGLGFCIWSAVWGLMMRAKIKRALLAETTSDDNVEFDAERITDKDIVSEESVVEADLVQPVDQPDTPATVPPLAAALPPQMQSGVPAKPLSQRPPVTTIGFDYDMNPQTPNGIKATWIMMIIGGIWGIFYACVSGFYITVSGMFTFEIVMFVFRIIATAFVLLTGVMALSRGFGRYTSKLYLTAGLQMITIMMCDFVNFALGIAGLICTSVGQSGYFISGRGARIGYFKKREKK